MAAVLLLVGACSSRDSRADDGGGVVDAGPEPVRAAFAVGDDPMPFGAVPWPDDLYLDAAGRVSVTALPGAEHARAYLDSLARAFADLDGFGVFGPVYFEFDGALDPGSLPADPGDTLEEDASVFLVDADTGSPTAFARIPAEVRLDDGGRRLALAPTRALAPGRSYAAVVTRAVRSEDGRRVEGAKRFVAIRDPEVLLDDPHQREARDRYTPVLETLVTTGLPRDEVAALAVFRVQTIDADLEDARTLVWSSEVTPPTASAALTGDALDGLLGTPDPTVVGLRERGGAPHGNLGWLVQGAFEAPGLLSAGSTTHGAIERSDAGELRVKRVVEVPFSLTLPLGALEGSALPVVLFQHGWGRERSDGLAVANALAASGYAVFLVDAPFHGSRVPGSDTVHRFTGASGADGFGDATGDFPGVLDQEGELVPLHPFYLRDAARQGVVELLVLVRMLAEVNWSELLAGIDPGLRGVGFDAERVGVVGVDLGGEIAMMLASVEPAAGALALAFAGGPTLDAWMLSPARSVLVETWLERLGRDPSELGDASDPPRFWPEVAAWQALVDRADPLAHATRLRGRPVNVLFWMARDDEAVHNRSTEALGLALGTELAGGSPRHEQGLGTVTIGAGATASGNFAIGDEAVTRILYALEPATHEALHAERGSVAYAHPIEVPFAPLDAPETVDNPIADVLTQLAFYFETWRACVPPAPGSACAASALAPE